MSVYASTIVNKAKSYIGTKEKPANSNNVIFNTHYYGKSVKGSAYPWCCVFIWDIFRMCGASKLFYDGKKTAYCPTLENWFKKEKRYYPSGQLGDICFMDFGKGRASHVGIVEKKNSDGTYTVIEGNTSTSSNDNGGKVMRRTRKKTNIRGFGRLKYDKKPSKKEYSGTFSSKTLRKGDKGTQVKYLQKFLNWYGNYKLEIDGSFGSATEKAVKAFQKATGLKIDGIFGTKSLSKAKSIKK